MARLGRGLAALIPNRSDDADEEDVKEDMIDQLNSMPDERLEEEQQQEEQQQEEEEVTDEVVEEKEAAEPVQSSTIHSKAKQVNVIEEFEDIDQEEGIEPPPAPMVTPITINPETGAVKAEEEKVDEVDPVSSEQVLDREVHNVPVGDIEVNPLQPRRSFVQAELDELAESLHQHGMLQPMVVMRKEDGRGYQIIAGERRWRAAKQLEWDTVPVVIRENVWGDRNRLELALTENVQRENLNPIEEAQGYQILHHEYGMTHEEIAERVGRNRVSITNILRLLQLPAEIQRGLTEEKISVGHAKAILMIPDEEKQLRFYKHVVEEGLTVRKAENRARNIQSSMNIDDPLRRKRRGRPAIAMKYDSKLQEHFDNNVRVKFNSSKNRFEVVFYAHSQGETEGLINKLLATEFPQDQSIQEQLED